MRNLELRSLLRGCSLFAMTLVGAACCTSPPPAFAPFVRSSEIAISVYVVDEDNPTVVVVPEDGYLELGKQVPHWLPVQGMVTKIEFGAGDNPFGEEVPCGFGHCKAKSAARKAGTFKYSVTVRYRGKEYRIDPRLIVG